MTIGAKLPSACQGTAKARKSTNFENKNNMAAACCAAVVSLIEELLADNSVLEEASSCEDDELLFFLLIDSKERKSLVRIDNYLRFLKRGVGGGGRRIPFSSAILSKIPFPFRIFSKFPLAVQR